MAENWLVLNDSGYKCIPKAIQGLLTNGSRHSREPRSCPSMPRFTPQHSPTQQARQEINHRLLNSVKKFSFAFSKQDIENTEIDFYVIGEVMGCELQICVFFSVT